MAAATLESVLNKVRPDWQRQLCIGDAPGNRLAARVKLVHDDTRSLFPGSLVDDSSQRARILRWQSLYQSDFIPLIKNYKDYRDREVAVPSRQHVDLRQDLKMPDKAFMTWKIPPRITREQAIEENDVEEEMRSASQQDLQQPMRHPTPGSAIHQRTLPDIKSGDASRVASTTRRSVTARDVKARENTPPDMGKPQSAPLMKTPPKAHRPKEVRAKELFKAHEPIHPDKSAAEQWLERANTAEKRAVKQAIIQMKKSKEIQKDPAAAAKEWLNDASERDRDVAMDFFKSVTGASLLGKAREPVQDLLNTDRPRAAAPKTADDPTGFKYLRLLTPETRRNKALYSTWHHMPNYQDKNPVMNKASHYTNPGKPPPRHFTIHPDWG